MFGSAASTSSTAFCTRSCNDGDSFGASQPPDVFDPRVVHLVERVSDAESFAMARRLQREEGLLRADWRRRVGPFRPTNRAKQDRIGRAAGLDVLRPDRDAVGVDREAFVTFLCERLARLDSS